MTRIVALGFSVLLLVGCGQATTTGGHVVGNGGDEVLLALKKGAEHARGVLGWLTPARLRRTGGELDQDDLFVLNDDNKAEIREELADVEIEVVDELPSFCSGSAHHGAACTLPERGAKIYARRDRCKTLSITGAGDLMLHEVLHHFLGEDERRVYRLGARIYRGFSDQAFVFPKGVRQVVPHEVGGAPAIWDGEALLSWNPYRDRALGRFVPGSGWQQVDLDPVPWWLAPPLGGTAKRPSAPPYADQDDVMLYSPSAGITYAFFYKAGFDKLWGLSVDFDMRVDTNTGKWEGLHGDKRAPRWGRLRWFQPSARVHYAASKNNFVVVATYANDRGQIAVFDPKTETWRKGMLQFHGDFTMHQAVASGEDSVRLVGRFLNRPSNETAVLRVNLTTFAMVEEGTFRDTGPRFRPIITPVNGGIVIFGGWNAFTGGTFGGHFRRDGAFLGDDSDQWQPIPANPHAGPIDGNLHILKERDRLHFFGDQWNTFTIPDGTWEQRPKDVGSFFAKVKLVLDAGDQMIFWNPISRDGFAVSW